MVHKVICEACAEKGITKYFKVITMTHLTRAHPELFPDPKTAIKEYQARYPEAEIGMPNNRTDRGAMTHKTRYGKTFSEWGEKQATKLYDELEALKDILEMALVCPHCKKKFKWNQDPYKLVDIINKQANLLKELLPSRSLREPPKGKKELEAPQKEALKGITPLLEKLANSQKERKIDERVAKCLNR